MSYLDRLNNDICLIYLTYNDSDFNNYIDFIETVQEELNIIIEAEYKGESNE